MLGLSISSLATNLKVQYEQRRFYIEEDEESIWQLLYPKHFVNISLHHVKEREKGRMKEIACSIRSNFTYNRKLFQNLKTSSVRNVSFDFEKFISEVLVDTSPQHQNRVGMQRSNVILINGAPGMGKTTLCKEIAYRWAKGNELLKHIDLVFLLFLRDPDLKKIHTIDQLIQYVEPSAFETAQHCTKLLSSCKNVVIIMDGFDEFSDTSSNSLVTYIIKRKALSHCKIIITSRPCASESLQNRADVVVEIKGFNEQNKEEYINNELTGDPERIRRLQLCLQRYSDINSVCYIPIIMSVLVFIIKRSGELPEDQVQLYNHFISFVISRSQQRLENSSAEVLLINKLPQMYHDYLLQLCRFAYEHIRNDSVIFTEEDINKACTSFNLSANKFYGLGLLHYTRYTEFINNKVAERVYCNFVHHSIQEYLAAYFISSLESCNQFLLLRSTFLISNYLSTWIMFAKMNKDKMFDCQQMLVYSCMQNFPVETRSSLLLFIENIFQNGRCKEFTICADVEVLCFQVGSQCVSENLSRSDHFNAYLSLCNISRNTGYLHMYLINDGTQNMSYKKMTERLLSDHNIATMILKNDMLIGYRIIEQQLNDGLGINKLLNWIILVDCHITINMTNAISSYVEEFNNVQGLCISECLIDSLQLNISSLTHLIVENINFSTVMIDNLADLIKRNPLLKFISMPNNNLQSFGFILLKALKTLTSIESLDLNNNNMGEAAAKHIADVINNNASIKQWLLSKNNSNSPIRLEKVHLASNNFKSSAVAVLQALQGITTLKSLDLGFNHLGGVVADDLACVIKHNFFLEELHLAGNDLNSSAIVVLQALQDITTLKLLDLSRNNMTSVIAEDLADVIKCNPYLEELHLACNGLNSSAILVLQALQEIRTLELLNLSINNLTSVVTEDMAGVIKCNPSLKKLNLAYNDLKSTAVVVLQALQGITTLEVLDLSCNDMTSVVAEDLACVIKCNSCLAELHLASNNLEATAVVVLQALQGITTLELLDLNFNHLTGVAAEDLACVIKSNSCLKKLYLSGNDLKSSGVVMLQALQGITTLKVLDLSFNHMTSVIAQDLVGVIEQNPCLEELHLAGNDLNSSAIVVLQALQEITTLALLDLNFNHLTGVVAEDLACVIKSNSCLKKLYLSGNDLKSSGVVMLQALQGITTLKVLDLSFNHMTSVIAKELVDVIKRNPCLEELHLACNDLNSSTIVVLQALQEITTLKLLDLSYNNMTSVVAQDLVGVIEQNPCLEELHLGYNDLNSCAIVVLQALQEITTLALLDLSRNNMTSVVAQDLAGVIEQNPCLEELHLGYNDLNSSAIEVFQALQEITALKLLDLSCNNMTSVVAQDLAGVINCNSCLEQLHLANNDLKSSAVAVLQALQGIATLKVLDLNFNNMTGVVAEDLAYVINRNSCLEKLYLSNNDLKSTAVVVLQALQGITTLEILNLSCNDMTSVVAEDLACVIKCNSCLVELHLASNNLETTAAVVLQALQGITTLELLDLSFNHLTGVVAEDLACVIKSNSCLKKLYLSGNDLKSSGVVILQALQGITTLKVLNLSFNDMTSVVAEDLAYVIKCNSCLAELHLASNNLETTGVVVLQALQGITTLELLDLNFNHLTGVVAEDLACVIKSNSCLKKLYLSGNDLKSSGVVILQALQGITALKVLNLNFNHMTSVIAKELVDIIKRNPCLEELHLAYNDLNSSAIEVFQALQEITTLKLLDLRGNNLTSVVAQDLVGVIEQNPCLEELHLGYNDLNSSAIEVFQALQEITTLKLLDLSCNNMISVVAQDLAGVIKCNPSLKKLHLANNDLKSSAGVVLQALQEITTVELLNLSQNSLSSVVAEDLASVIECSSCLMELRLADNDLKSTAVLVLQALKETTTLKLLDLNNNDMTGVVAEDLADVINCNSCLEELHLANNDLKSSAIAVLQASQGIATLKVLDLSFNNMTGVVAEDLAYVINRNSCLEKLYLSGNDLKSTAVVVLQALQGITTLEVLDLSCNDMTSVVAEDLACVIKCNSCLAELHLASNNLETTGVVVLQALQGITTLELLDLNFNHLTGVVAEDLACVIKSNSCLKKLYLSGNDLKSSGVVMLQALQGITALKVLDLDLNHMTSVIAKELVDVIKRNPYLEELYLAYNDLNSSTIVVLQALQEIRTLKLLDLSGNSMTSVVAQDLAGVIKCNPSLTKIDLANNDLKSSAGVVLQALQEVTTVELLNLSQNNLSSVVAEDLAIVIECSSCLMELHLADNDLKSTAVLVLQALKETKTLKLLDLNNNSMTGVVAEDLADVINCNSWLEELYLANNDLKSSAVLVLQALKETKTLKLLDLNNNGMTGVVAEDLADVINCNSCLEELYLAGNDLKSTAVLVLQALKETKTLKLLDLNNNGMTGVVAEDLADVINCNSCLEELHLANNDLKSSAVAVLQALQGIATLKILDLSFNNMTGVVAEDLAYAINRNSCLEKLNLSDNDLKSTAVVVLQALQGITTLKVLNLSFNDMTSVVAEDLACVIKSNSCLKKLYLYGNDLKSSGVVILQALQGITTLKVLNLSFNDMTSVVAEDLAYVIKCNSCLAELHLASNNLETTGVVVLQALQGITTLELLDLNFNHLTGVVAEDLACVIKSNSCLKKLYLSGNDLKSSGVVILQALQGITALKVLDLSFNHMTSVIAKELVDIIKRNPCLEELHLAYNDLNSSTIVVLQALQEISTLKLLDLRGNNMTSVVAQDLAGVIEQNPCLEKLHLADNDLSSSAIVILQALQAITTLKLLDLSFNNLTNVVVEDLAGVIKCNPCLEKLDIANNELNSSAIVVIQTLHEIATLNLLDLSFNNMTSDDLAECNLCLELYLANND